MLSVLSTILLLASNNTAQNKDDLDWVPLQGVPNLYYFGDVPKSWPQAHQFCRSHNSQLVSIETKMEFFAILNHLQKLDYGTTLSFWTSGSDAYQEGNWVWMGSGEPFSFKDWCNGEPSDKTKGENCMQIVGKSDGCWNDAPCSWSKYGDLEFRFICEKTDFCL